MLMCGSYCHTLCGYCRQHILQSIALTGFHWFILKRKQMSNLLKKGIYLLFFLIKFKVLLERTACLCCWSRLQMPSAWRRWQFNVCLSQPVLVLSGDETSYFTFTLVVQSFLFLELLLFFSLFFVSEGTVYTVFFFLFLWISLLRPDIQGPSHTNGLGVRILARITVVLLH